MHLPQIGAFGQGGALDESAPAVRVGQPGVADAVEDVVFDFDGGDGAVEEAAHQFLRAGLGWGGSVSKIGLVFGGCLCGWGGGGFLCSWMGSDKRWRGVHTVFDDVPSTAPLAFLRH